MIRKTRKVQYAIPSGPITEAVVVSCLREAGFLAFMRSVLREYQGQSLPLYARKNPAFTRNGGLALGGHVSITLYQKPATSKAIRNLHSFSDCSCCGCGKSYRWYMVRDSVWDSAWPEAEEDRLRAAELLEVEPCYLTCGLCLKCLKRKLGRDLTLRDFSRFPINKWVRAKFKEGGLARVLKSCLDTSVLCLSTVYLFMDEIKTSPISPADPGK